MLIQLNLKNIAEGIKKNILVYKEIWIILGLSILFFYKLLIHYGQMIYPASDVIAMYSFWRSILVENALKYHTIPLWNPYAFSGMPIIGDSQSGLFYPFTFVFFLIPVNLAFGYLFILDISLIGFFTYLYARFLGLGKYPSLISSICIMFNSTVILRIFPGHLFILDSIIWFPLLLFFYEATLKKRSFSLAICSSLPLSFMILAGHIQPVVYAYMASFAYFYLRVVREKETPKILLLTPFISLVISFLLCAIHILPVIELSRISERSLGLSYKFASDFSLPPKQLIALILPHFFGSPLTSTYWGKGNFEGLAVYSGILPLLFVFISFLLKRNRYVVIFFILAIFSLLFSFGEYGPIFPFFYHFVPGFNVFRVPTRFLFVFGFSVSILAGYGSSILLNKKLAMSERKLKILFGFLVSFGICGLLFLLAFTQLPGKIQLFERYVLHNSRAIGISRIPLLQQIENDIGMSSFFLLTSGLIFYLAIRGKTQLFILLSFLFILLDLWMFSLPFYSVKNPDSVFSTPRLIQKIKKDTSRFRVFDMSGEFNTPLNTKRLESLTGINSSFLSSYRKYLWLTGNHLENKYENFLDFYSIKNTLPLELLNTKYIISKKELKIPGVKKMFYNKSFLYEVENSLPRSFVVPNAKIIKNSDNVLSEISQKKFIPQNTVILEETPPSLQNKQEFKSAEIIHYEPNSIVVKTDLHGSGFLVLSEIWYPGWSAYDNGEKIKIYRANYMFRAVYLKSGSHIVKFIYEPFSYKIGLTISTISVILLILYFIYILKNESRRNNLFH